MMMRVWSNLPVEAKISYLPPNKKVEVGIKHFALSSEFYLLELF
jgi:hypothetical protein